MDEVVSCEREESQFSLSIRKMCTGQIFQQIQHAFETKYLEVQKCRKCTLGVQKYGNDS